jgi:hypothetical protein
MDKEKVSNILGEALGYLGRAIKDDDVQSVLFGKYADGSTRNVIDGIKGEYQSPKMKKKIKDRKKKKKYKYSI